MKVIAKKIIDKELLIIKKRDHGRNLMDGLPPKWRLFAVTQDAKAREKERKRLEKTIKEGRYEVGAGKMISATGKGGKINFELALMDKCGAFDKVLGEISKQAIWVKDGDEIEVEVEPYCIVKKWLKTWLFQVKKWLVL